MTDKRILVLGSAPHARFVSAYTWDNLPEDLNVADYPVVILNFVPLQDEAFAETAKRNRKGFPDRAQFCRLLFREGAEVIAIGTPKELFATWWLPLHPTFVHEPGEDIKVINPEFSYYFQHVRRWSFHTGAENQWTLERRVDEGNIGVCLDAIYPKSAHLSLTLSPIANTGSGQAIAFRLNLTAIKGGGERKDSSHNIFWLPPTTEITHYEAVNLILREKYDLLLEQTAPAWVESYKLPNQVPIETEIARIDQEIQRLTAELVATQHQLQGAAHFRKLLYEQGEDALEPIVRDALRALGAQVTDPPPRQGREDGRLVDPAGRNGMLEIKGRTGTLRLSDVRQLNQWVQDAIVEENWTSKGILIANLELDKQPTERGEIFPSNCIQAAERTGLCLMTTTQLFNALCAHQLSQLDVTAFWDTIFNTSGLCSLPELGPPAAPEPE